MAEQQRDEAMNHMKALKDKLETMQGSQSFTNSRELRGMSIQKLKNIQVIKFNSIIQKIIY